MVIRKKTTLLCMIMMVVLSACGNNSDNNVENNTDVNAETNTETGTDNNTENNADDKSESYAYISGINAADYVTLGEYKGIEITEEDPSISQEEVEQYIDRNLLVYYAVKNPIEDRTDVREGDTANIDYIGYRDGVDFDCGTAQGYDLVIC